MREKFKIKFIEKKIGKKFVQKTVPLGSQVCEAQLLHLISRVKNVEVDDAQIDPYLPEINKMLEGMSSDELVKRFVSLEFNRFLAYYRNAPDLNVQDKQPRREVIRGKLTPLFLNIGKLDRFTPKDLMVMINRGTRSGENVQIGRINITQSCSFFDVAEGDSESVMEILNGADFAGRTVRVEIADGNKTRRPSRRDRNSGGGGRDSGRGQSHRNESRGEDRGGSRDNRRSSGGYASNSNRTGQRSNSQDRPQRSSDSTASRFPGSKKKTSQDHNDIKAKANSSEKPKRPSTTKAPTASTHRKNSRKPNKTVDDSVPPWARKIANKNKKKK
jgi:ATP-dependent RNA helicase DeaD